MSWVFTEGYFQTDIKQWIFFCIFLQHLFNISITCRSLLNKVPRVPKCRSAGVPECLECPSAQLFKCLSALSARLSEFPNA